MSPLPPLEDDEEHLWRGVFDGGRAKKEYVQYRDFMERVGERAISVNRLDHAGEDEVARVSELAGQNRNRPLRRWAKVRLGDARQCGRTVDPSPNEGNPYHADIVLPAFNGNQSEHRQIQRRHAQSLAVKAKWSDVGE